MVKPSQITVVTVTYNSQDNIKDFLTSVLKKSVGSPIIVVDNNSQDKTVNLLKRYSDQIILVESDINLGFAKANNLGFSKVSTDFVCFLNPDTHLIKENCLVQLALNLEEYPRFGIIGPKIIHPDGSILKTTRRFPTIINALKEYLFKEKGAYDFYLPDSNQLCEVETVTGAVMMMKKDLFKKTGGFNEKYFLYFEDIDLCYQIARTGLKVGYDPNVIISHVMGASGKGQKVNQLLIDSAKKYHGLLGYFLISLIIRVCQVLHR